MRSLSHLSWIPFWRWLAEHAICKWPSLVSCSLMLTRPLLVLQGKTRLARTCASTREWTDAAITFSSTSVACGLIRTLYVFCFVHCTGDGWMAPFHLHIVLVPHGSSI